MKEKESCPSIGAPNFNLSKCELCRDQADPLYKQCLTLRITGQLLTSPYQPVYSELSQKAELN